MGSERAAVVDARGTVQRDDCTSDALRNQRRDLVPRREQCCPGARTAYARLFQTLITDWRRQWGEGDFPFFFVQIANYKANLADDWPEVREAQQQALSLVN